MLYNEFNSSLDNLGRTCLKIKRKAGALGQWQSMCKTLTSIPCTSEKEEVWLMTTQVEGWSLNLSQWAKMGEDDITH